MFKQCFKGSIASTLTTIFTLCVVLFLSYGGTVLADTADVINQYYELKLTSSTEEFYNLFTEDVDFHAPPNYHAANVEDIEPYYNKIMSDYVEHGETILDTIVIGNIGAVFSEVSVISTSGETASFECVDWFVCEDGKIKSLKIFYDPLRTPSDIRCQSCCLCCPERDIFDVEYDWGPVPEGGPTYHIDWANAESEAQVNTIKNTLNKYYTYVNSNQWIRFAFLFEPGIDFKGPFNYTAINALTLVPFYGFIGLGSFVGLHRIDYPVDIMISGNTAIVLLRGTADMPIPSLHINFPAIDLFVLDDGRIEELYIWFDTYQWPRWAACTLCWLGL